MARYNLYHGKFLCGECKEEVNTLRSYPDLKQLSWMCKQKHVTLVDLNTKKKKADFD